MTRSPTSLTLRDILQGKAKARFGGFQNIALLCGCGAAIAVHVASFWYDGGTAFWINFSGFGFLALGLAACAVYNRIKYGVFIVKKERK